MADGAAWRSCRDCWRKHTASGRAILLGPGPLLGNADRLCRCPGDGILDLQSTAEAITPLGLRSSSTNLLPVGTVLYSTRATIGKLAIARVPVATNQGFNNLIAKPGVCSKYLAYALQFFTPDITRLAGSTTFKEVSRSSLRGFKIPVPAESEQQRIVDLLGEADRLRRLRREADAKAARVFRAVSQDVRQSRRIVKNREPGQSCSDRANTSKSEPEFWTGSIPWVSPKDMKCDLIDDAEDHISEAAVRQSATQVVPAESVLIVVRGMILARHVPLAFTRRRVISTKTSRRSC